MRNNIAINNRNQLFKYINHKSEYGFDIPDISMFGMVKISAESYPYAPAFEYFGMKCSYKTLIEKIEKVSACYFELGVRKGDIVSVIMPNTPEAVISIYALNRIGAVANIIHPLCAREEIKRYIVSSNSKFLLCIDLCYHKINHIIDETALERVVLASADNSMPGILKILYRLKKDNKSKPDKKDKRFISWDKFLVSVGCASEYFPRGSENDKPAIILHSGGTTGTPKDIMLTNRNFNAFGMQSVLTLRDVSVGDKILAVLPIFHGFGLGVCVHVAFCFGACSVLIPKFNAKRLPALLKKYKPTMLFGVPTLYEALLKSKGSKNLDLSFLKYAVSGGDLLPKKLEESVNSFFKDHNSHIRICEGYGMTEGLAALSLSVGDAYKSGTIGKPLIGNKMCVVKPGTIEELPIGSDGELCVSGPTVMIGYRNSKKETANTLRVHKDGKVWLHTGDLASIDKDGFVKYKLRLKRMIISSGFNVYPTEIEKTIEKLNFVEKCVVVSIPHDYKKEVPKAFIILKKEKAGTKETENEIREFCKQQLSYHSVPQKYEFVSILPKTAYNKIDFMKLQKDSVKEAII